MYASLARIPVLGVSNHQVVGWKYSMMSRVRFTMAWANSKFLTVSSLMGAKETPLSAFVDEIIQPKGGAPK